MKKRHRRGRCCSAAVAAAVGAAAVRTLAYREWFHALFELLVVRTSHINRTLNSIRYAFKTSPAFYRTPQPVHQVLSYIA